MLWGHRLPNFASVGHNAVSFTLLSPNYLGLSDKRPGIRTLFRQDVGGTPTLTLTIDLNTTDGNLDFNTIDYPYLMVGVINIGTAPYEGQILPNCNLFLNGKWGGGGGAVATGQAVIGPSGYSSFWGVVPRSNIIGATPTTTLTAQMQANFVTAFGNFGIGEVVVCGVNEIPIGEARIDLVDPSKINRSSGNVPWPVVRRGFRKVGASIVPQTRGDSFGATSAKYTQPLQSIILSAARTGGHVIAPVWRNPGASAADVPTLLQNAMMARLVDPTPSLAGSATENHFRGTLNFEELL